MKKRHASTGLFCAVLLSSCTAIFAGDIASASGVTGIVSLSPGCPGPQSKDKPCFKPLRGKEVQLVDSAGKVIGRSTTGDDGKFTINAMPGKYALKVVVDALYPKCPAVEISIKENLMAEANVSCESGMR